VVKKQKSYIGEIDRNCRIASLEEEQNNNVEGIWTENKKSEKGICSQHNKELVAYFLRIRSGRERIYQQGKEGLAEGKISLYGIYENQGKDI